MTRQAMNYWEDMAERTAKFEVSEYSQSSIERSTSRGTEAFEKALGKENRWKTVEMLEKAQLQY